MLRISSQFPQIYRLLSLRFCKKTETGFLGIHCRRQIFISLEILKKKPGFLDFK